LASLDLEARRAWVALCTCTVEGGKTCRPTSTNVLCCRRARRRVTGR